MANKHFVDYPALSGPFSPENFTARVYRQSRLTLSRLKRTPMSQCKNGMCGLLLICPHILNAFSSCRNSHRNSTVSPDDINNTCKVTAKHRKHTSPAVHTQSIILWTIGNS